MGSVRLFVILIYWLSSSFDLLMFVDFGLRFYLILLAWYLVV